MTGWGWHLASPSSIWPREEWGFPLSLHPLKPGNDGLCRQGGASTLFSLAAAATLALTLHPWCQEVAPLHNRRFGAHAANWENGEMPPHHPSCRCLGSRGSKHAVLLCPLLFFLVFPSVCSVSAVALWYYLMLDFPFMLSPYLFDLSWAPPVQALPRLAQDFCFFCAGGSDSEDEEGGTWTWPWVGSWTRWPPQVPSSLNYSVIWGPWLATDIVLGQESANPLTLEEILKKQW